mgnify:CR=1 FL=1
MIRECHDRRPFLQRSTQVCTNRGNGVHGTRLVGPRVVEGVRRNATKIWFPRSSTRHDKFFVLKQHLCAKATPSNRYLRLPSSCRAGKMGTDHDESRAASDSALPLTLTQRMRDRSRDLHDKSNKLVNLKLALVLTSKPLYAEAISLFWPIYRELELILEKHKEHAQLRNLHDLLPLLRRAPVFELDMTSLLESKSSADLLMARRISTRDGQEQFSPPELQDYINHLRMLSEKDPILLIPYYSSMYGAIFAGGSIIKRMAKRAFSLKNDEGLEIFNISIQDSRFENVNEIRNEMKRRIDELMEISEKDQDRIVQESPQVFMRNNALIATAQDSDVFKEVWSKCRQYLLLIPTVAVVIVGMWVIRDK